MHGIIDNLDNLIVAEENAVEWGDTVEKAHLYF